MNEEMNVQEPVTDVTENTETQSAEQFEEGIELTDTTSNEEKKEVKSYTEEELEKIVNDRIQDILPSRLEREKIKIEKNYREKLSKYEETESILSAGLGTKDISESNKKMREFYKEQGIDIPAYQKPSYSEEDEKALGELDAKKIISLGFDEMQEEANNLASIGTDKMTPRQKVMFTTLATELTYQKQKRELAKLGVKEDVLNNSEFKEFASQFNSKTPIQNVYEMYTKMKPQKQYEQIGSMKNNKEPVQKDYYTNEEIEIQLDPTLTPQENSKKYFDSYGKLKRTEEALTEQLVATREEIDHLETISNALDIAVTESDLVPIREELIQFGFIHKSPQSSKGSKMRAKSKPLHYISSDGFDMYVGKNNFQNDELTFKFATGNDWWFHAKKMAGSHVIVKAPDGELPDRAFEEAGRLAAYYSKGKEAPKVEIDYIQKKHVKKPGGAKPGFVVYYTNYSLVAEPDISGLTLVAD